MSEAYLEMSIEDLVDLNQSLGREVDAIQEKRKTVMNVLNEKVRRKDLLARAGLVSPVQPTSIRTGVR